MEQAETSKINIQEPEKQEVLHEFVEGPKDRLATPKKIVIVALIVGLGTITGYFLSGSKTGQKLVSEKGIPKIIKTEKTVGSTDVKTFRDKAEGILEKGGIDGEGTHKLVRDPKRPDQNVYMTSSVINLDDYIGKKVRVWGETFAAQKAGWLMDVGKIELL